MPETPFMGTLRYDAEGLRNLAERVRRATVAPGDAAFDAARVQHLRSQYLKGGSTAVQTTNTFDTLLPILVARLDDMRAVNFETEAEQGLDWLRLLARLLDLKADQEWFCDTLRAARKRESTSRGAPGPRPR
jgi:hypothetical protein